MLFLNKKMMKSWQNCLLQSEHDENFRDDATIFEESSALPTYTVPVLMPDSELNAKIRPHNENQQQLFNILQSWAKQ